MSSGVSGDWGFLDFDPRDTDTDTLVLRVATSMISEAQAEANHRAEVTIELMEASVWVRSRLLTLIKRWRRLNRAGTRCYLAWISQMWALGELTCPIWVS